MAILCKLFLHNDEKLDKKVDDIGIASFLTDYLMIVPVLVYYAVDLNFCTILIGWVYGYFSIRKCE